MSVRIVFYNICNVCCFFVFAGSGSGSGGNNNNNNNNDNSDNNSSGGLCKFDVTSS